MQIRSENLNDVVGLNTREARLRFAHAALRDAVAVLTIGQQHQDQQLAIEIDSITSSVLHELRRERAANPTTEPW